MWRSFLLRTEYKPLLQLQQSLPNSANHTEQSRFHRRREDHRYNHSYRGHSVTNPTQWGATSDSALSSFPAAAASPAQQIVAHKFSVAPQDVLPTNWRSSDQSEMVLSSFYSYHSWQLEHSHPAFVPSDSNPQVLPYPCPLQMQPSMKSRGRLRSHTPEEHEVHAQTLQPELELCSHESTVFCKVHQDYRNLSRHPTYPKPP